MGHSDGLHAAQELLAANMRPRHPLGLRVEEAGKDADAARCGQGLVSHNMSGTPMSHTYGSC